jgi:hypothetical protein
MATTFPTKQPRSFGGNFAGELQNFMSNERTFTDPAPVNSSNGGRGCGDPYRGNGPNYGRGRFDGRGKRPWGDDSICHKYRGHLWGQCYDNPRGQRSICPQQILVAIQTDADVITFKDETNARQHLTKPTNKEAEDIFTTNNNNPV